MRKITLDIEDSHFAAFEQLARLNNLSPLDIITKQIKATADMIEQYTQLSAVNLLEQYAQIGAASAMEKLHNEIFALSLAQLTVGPTFDQEVSERLKGSLEERRASRLAILQHGGALWEGEPGKPKDGLAYERELRAEW